MKFVLKLLAIVLLCFMGQLFLPWWAIAIFPFVVEVAAPSSKGYPFFIGFYAVFILWATQALIIDFQTDAILANKVAALFKIKDMHLTVVMIAGIVGGIVGGLSSLTGSYFRKAFFAR